MVDNDSVPSRQSEQKEKIKREDNQKKKVKMSKARNKR
jgi:hypothetical protein